MQEPITDRLMDFFDQSTTAYKNYLAGSKTFRFASVLKTVNMQALQLLRENRSSFDPVLFADIDALVHHYTEWSRKWDELAASKTFEPDEEFVFANEVTFPREAAARVVNRET